MYFFGGIITQLFLAILLCLFFVLLLAFGEVFFRLDKMRAYAIISINNMIKDLDIWVLLTVELADCPGLDPEEADHLRTLSTSYSACQKYKKKFTKIKLINSMAELTDSETLGYKHGDIAEDMLGKRRDAACDLAPLCDQYNRNADELNRRLDKKVPGLVGRLLGVSKLEKLCDLTKM